MAYEMDKADRDYYEPVTRIKNVMKKVFNEHYPQGLRLPIPKFVKDKEPHANVIRIYDTRKQGQSMDCQQTDTPTKWRKHFYLPSITLSRKVEQVEDNVWKITPYICFSGKVVFSNNHWQRCGKQLRPNQNGYLAWQSQWVPSDTYEQYGRGYTVGVLYSNKSQGMEAFTQALTAYTSWLRDVRDVNSLEQLNRLTERYQASIENSDDPREGCATD
jgi:hypothetical protein